MAETAEVSTFIVRLVREPGGAVSGVVERVRTGFKEKFDGREALCRLINQIVEEKGGSGEPR